jgi:hypothetical protein
MAFCCLRYPSDLPGREAEEIELYAQLSSNLQHVAIEQNGRLFHRYAISHFSNLLGSIAEEALRLRYTLRSASVVMDNSQSASVDILNQIRSSGVLTSAEASKLQRSSLGTFIHLCLSSAVDLASRRFVAANLNDAKGVGPLIDYLFALQQRIPPPLSSLVSECQQSGLLQPVDSSPAIVAAADLLAPDNILSTMTGMVDGHINTRYIIFAAVEELALKHGLSDVLDQFSEQQKKQLRQDRLPRGTARDEATRRMLGFINRTHKLDYTLSHRLDGGWSNGAYLLQNKNSDASSDKCDNEGKDRAAVLKWNVNKDWAQQVLQAGPLIARACAAGYPTPPWLAFGVSPSGYPYQVQAFAAGSPADEVSIELVDALLPIFDMQRNFKPDKTTHNWTARDFKIVFDSPEMHRRLLNSADEAMNQLYSTLMAWVTPYKGADLTTDDLVHGDLNLTNILVDRYGASDGGEPHQGQAALPGIRVTFIDSEGLGYGSVMHDVTTVMIAAFRSQATVAFERLLSYATAVIRKPADLHLATVARIMVILNYAHSENRVAVIKECHELLSRVHAHAHAPVRYIKTMC